MVIFSPQIRNDLQKYEIARKLKRFVKNIQKCYTKDMKSADQTKRQLAVALYFIDKVSSIIEF